MTDDIATIRNHLLPRIATNGTIVCSFCGASDVTDDDHRPGCVILEVRERLDRVADRLAAAERDREQAEGERDDARSAGRELADERNQAQAAAEIFSEALERISGQECKRFTDDDPRECVETKREPCDRCVALAALIASENLRYAADLGRYRDAKTKALAAQVETLTEALRQIADYGHEMDDYDLPPRRARELARAALGETDRKGCDYHVIYVNGCRACAALGETDQRHLFIGRPDRWCEFCNLPDRHPIHRLGETNQ